MFSAAAIIASTLWLSRKTAYDGAIAAAMESARGSAALIRAQQLAQNLDRRARNRYLAQVVGHNPLYSAAWIDLADNAFDGLDSQYANANAAERLGLRATGRLSLLWVKGEKGIEPDLSEGESFESVAQEDYYRVAAEAKKEAVVDNADRVAEAATETDHAA